MKSELEIKQEEVKLRKEFEEIMESDSPNRMELDMIFAQLAILDFVLSK